MTEHESIHSMLALYAADALDPAESRRVEQHAASCEMCARELLAWGSFAAALPQLPQPVPPADLIERTQVRILEQRRASAARRREGLLLAALVVFGWIASFTTWNLVRMFTGGVLEVLGANLVGGVTWSLVSTVFVWMTAAAAAAMLGKRNEWRRNYEPVS